MSNRGVIRVSGKPINLGVLLISFEVLPGTDPRALGHFISVWEGKEVLSPSEAVYTQMIGTSSATGEILLNDLAIGEKDYMIGYGIDGYEEMNTICATLTLPVLVRTGEVLKANLTDIFINQDVIGTDSLIAQLSVPLFYQDKNAVKWIALFQGPFNKQMYSGRDVIAVCKCFVPQNCAAIHMNNIPQGLQRYETYTLVHGLKLNAAGDPDYSALVCYHTFIVWKSNLYIGSQVSGSGSALNDELQDRTGSVILESSL